MGAATFAVVAIDAGGAGHLHDLVPDRDEAERIAATVGRPGDRYVVVLDAAPDPAPLAVVRRAEELARQLRMADEAEAQALTALLAAGFGAGPDDDPDIAGGPDEDDSSRWPDEDDDR